MPKEVFNREWEFLARELLLTFEEISRVTRIFTGLGVEKIRITGGEPLMRRGIPDLVRSLSAVDGIEDIALTTNGSLLARRAAELADAGLSRVSVSLDSLDDETFMAMNDVGFSVAKVLDGIEAAAAVGLTPVKVNVVVKRGVNDEDVVPMGCLLQGHRSCRPLHRVHGCRSHQRVASRRCGPRGGDCRRHRRRTRSRARWCQLSR